VGATGVLIRKELRQHWLAFGFLACLLGLAAASVLAMHYFRGVSSSVFLATGILLRQREELRRRQHTFAGGSGNAENGIERD